MNPIAFRSFARSRRLGAALISAAVLGTTLGAVGCGSTQIRAADDTAPEFIAAPGVVMTVEGLGCPMCAESISVLLKDIEGVEGSKVNLEDGTVAVRVLPGARVARADLVGAVNDGGFSYRGMRVME